MLMTGAVTDYVTLRAGALGFQAELGARSVSRHELPAHSSRTSCHPRRSQDKKCSYRRWLPCQGLYSHSTNSSRSFYPLVVSGMRTKLPDYDKEQQRSNLFFVFFNPVVHSDYGASYKSSPLVFVFCHQSCGLDVLATSLQYIINPSS